MALEVGGQTIELDEEGYLVDLSSWTPEIAAALATGEDVELSMTTGISLTSYVNTMKNIK